MKTRLKGPVSSVAAHLDKVDLATIPGPDEIEAVLQKRLTKGHITLRPLAAGDLIQAGDTVTISTESATPRFNKPQVLVTVGNGLYDRDVEAALVGMGVGDSCTITIRDAVVHISVLQAMRKEVPPVTAAMVAELGIEGVETVEQYRAHLTRELMRYTLGKYTHQLVSALADETEMDEPDSEDLDRLGLLEAEWFRSALKERQGVLAEELPPAELKGLIGFESLAEMMQARRDWYATNLRQCLVMMDVLGVAGDDEYDPTIHHGAHSRLFGRMVDYVAAELMRRKAADGSSLR
jgi:hypothetical protein